MALDKDKLCLEGHSAGAHLVLLAAATPDDARLAPPEGLGGVSQDVAAVCAIYPPTLFHLGEARPSGSLPARVLPGADASEEAAALASPIEHVTPDLPPVMLLHGDADKVVPVSASRRYEERVRAVGGKCDLHVYAGLPHGFANHPEICPAMMQHDRRILPPLGHRARGVRGGGAGAGRGGVTRSRPAPPPPSFGWSPPRCAAVPLPR